MKPYIQPVPEEQPRPEEQPAPAEPPRRRTFTLPTFGPGTNRTGVTTFATLLLIMGITAAQAQTQPVPDPPTTPGVPTRPMDPDERPIQPSEPQQPVTPRTRTNDGWVMFDDRSTRALGLEEDQLQRLKGVDGRYRKDYMGLGEVPNTNPGYNDLSERRNKDVRGILTPEQYDRWLNDNETPAERMDHQPDGSKRNEATPEKGKNGTGQVKVKSGTTSTPRPTNPPNN